MIEKSFLSQKLCSAFCVYYKPAKKEELACRGYTVLEHLLQKNTLLSFERSGEQGTSALAEVLVAELCMTCPFFAQDCDFMQDRSAPPCGGFVLLAQHLESGALTLADIQ